LAHAQHFLDIIVEGDAKVCIEAISQSTEAIPWPWRIMPLISNVKCLALNFFFFLVVFVGLDVMQTFWLTF
jgi:hypothetical protein